jgi:hypothetical protein
MQRLKPFLFWRRYEDAPLGMESIRRAGFLAAIDVTALEGYPRLL